MILPEDTKVPLPSDDEDDFDFSTPEQPYDHSSPSQLARTLAQAYTDEPHSPVSSTPEDHHSRSWSYNTDYPYPPSPRSAVTAPLLSDPDENGNDIELGPAPPYSVVDAHPNSSAAVFARSRNGRERGARGVDKSEPFLRRARRRFGKAIIFSIIIYCFITGATVISMRAFRGVGGGPHRHHPSGNEDLPHRPPTSPPTTPPLNGDDWKTDGTPKQCIQLDPSIWSPYENYIPPKPQIGSRRAANSTFILPTLFASDLFTHLNGPAGVGRILFSTYDSNSDAVFESDTRSSPFTIIGSNEMGQSPKRGEYVRVTVEAIYDMLDGVGDDEDATIENSPGWDMLEASKLCYMERIITPPTSPNSTTSTTSSFSSTDIEQRSENDDRGIPTSEHILAASGVGIYTNKPAEERHSGISDSLRFRIHVALPTMPSGPPSLTQSIVETLVGAASSISSIPLDGPRNNKNGHHHHPDRAPREYVASLSMNAGVADYELPDLTKAGIGRLELISSVGQMDLADVRAESIKLRTLGEISGKVGVSHSLEVATPAGQVDLDLAVTRRPPFSILPHPDFPFFPPPPNGNLSSRNFPSYPDKDHREGDIDPCSAPPVDIHVMANNDLANLRHVEWDSSIVCRGVSVLLESMVGSISFQPHALFEGSYKLSTAIGEINVDLNRVDGMEDPEGLGRWRNVTLTKHDRVATKLWKGEIHWEKKIQAGKDDSDEDNQENDIDDEEEEAEEEEEEEVEVEVEQEEKRRVVKKWNEFEGGTKEIKKSERQRSHSRTPSIPGMPHPKKLKKTIVIETSVGSIDLIL